MKIGIASGKGGIAGRIDEIMTNVINGDKIPQNPEKLKIALPHGGRPSLRAFWAL